MKQRLKRPVLKLLWSVGSILGPRLDRPLHQDRIARILAFQGGGVGDVIRLFPALRSLHRAFPRASISVLTQFGERLFCLFPSPEIVSDHVLYELHGRHAGLRGKLGLIRRLRRRRFDLVFSPNYGLGMIEATVMSFLIGAPYRIGFDHGGAGFLFTTKRPLTATRAIQDQELDLLVAAGLPPAEAGEYLRVPEDALAFARSALDGPGARQGGPVIAISPEVKTEARYQAFPEYRAWPMERYAELTAEVIRRFGATVILLGAAGEAGFPIGSSAEITGVAGPILDFRGRTSLAQAAALIACADMFIGNDSGLLHMAIGLQTQCVAIFGATTPRQVIPSSDQCVPLWKGLPCSPCFTHQPLFDLVCPYGIECLRSITVGEVLAAAEPLLRRRGSGELPIPPPPGQGD